VYEAVEHVIFLETILLPAKNDNVPKHYMKSSRKNFCKAEPMKEHNRAKETQLLLKPQ